MKTYHGSCAELKKEFEGGEGIKNYGSQVVKAILELHHEIGEIRILIQKLDDRLTRVEGALA